MLTFLHSGRSNKVDNSQSIMDRQAKCCLVAGCLCAAVKSDKTIIQVSVKMESDGNFVLQQDRTPLHNTKFIQQKLTEELRRGQFLEPGDETPSVI